MRIVSGKYKGRRIQAPKNLPVRPTTDMAKESLFNIINNLYCFDTITVLDLFSGTGNISYEFASRGTHQIIAVDKHYGCVKFINDTTKQLDLSINVVKSDVYGFLNKTGGTFDVIFADPPYRIEDKDLLKIIDVIFSRHLLNEDGILIIEHASQTDLSEHPKLRYKKKYGGNVFSFFND